eukprot:3372040-Rhodomonas_salina.2
MIADRGQKWYQQRLQQLEVRGILLRHSSGYPACNLHIPQVRVQYDSEPGRTQARTFSSLAGARAADASSDDYCDSIIVKEPELQHGEGLRVHLSQSPSEDDHEPLSLSQAQRLRVTCSLRLTGIGWPSQSRTLHYTVTPGQCQCNPAL